MVKTSIASTAAIFTFGLAALGGTVVALAAPAYADNGSTTSSGPTSTAPKPDHSLYTSIVDGRDAYLPATTTYVGDDG